MEIDAPSITRKHTLVHNFLEESAQFFRDKIALVHEETRASYSAINTMANQFALFLKGCGVMPGDRVVYVFENCLEYVVCYYGILKTGGVAVAMSTDLTPPKFKPLINELEPRVICVSSRYERLLWESDITKAYAVHLVIATPQMPWHEKDVGFIVHSLEEIFCDEQTPNPHLDIAPSSLASIIYTSGSTGIPKGVMLTHNNIIANTNSICEYLALTDQDTQMVVLPFFYVMGKSLLNTHFAVGGRVVINNKFVFTAAVVKEMAEEHVTGFSGVPSTYAYLLHRSPLAQYRDKLPHLRYCSQAGGHMAAQTKIELRRALPDHTDIVIMYGATEASARLTWLDPRYFETKIESIGVAIPNVTVRVLDNDGKELPVGEVGELVASGPNIMKGYWKDEVLTHKVLDANGYHTGDMGYRDAEGFLFVIGRKDNQLKVGGHRINLQEIEDALLKTEQLIEVAVVGFEDPLMGNKLIGLAVALDSSCREEDVLRKCAQILPKFKVPQALYFIQSLPKTVNGKVNRSQCHDMIQKIQNEADIMNQRRS